MKKEEKVIGIDIPVVFACSGASKEGEMADLITRKLYRDGNVHMSCLAAVSAQISPFLKKLKTDEKVVALDGCSKNCVSRTLKNTGFSGFLHVRLDKIGVTDEKMRVNKKEVVLAAQKVQEVITNSFKRKRLFSYSAEKDLLLIGRKNK